ncbi:hypothetical protein D0Z00_001532 [Geotrichum galactomycetum]|uniref:Uncharacterized protein n=1 Tax=Geotrichum galactomycetum TaxID=27317 RepID=A0ACB6V6Q2_9ASCO|nr:hypothetical protein D0Z00_001532 [Geotrichum candidum]
MLRRSPALLRQQPVRYLQLFSTRILARRLHSQRWLDNVITVFPNTKDLHARVALVLDNCADNNSAAAFKGKGVVRVAFVPFNVHPSVVNRLVDVVLADPLASDLEWYRALRTRRQGAETLIKYNRMLTKVEITPSDSTADPDDAKLEFGVPFTVPRLSSGQPDNTRIADPREIEIYQLRTPTDHSGRFHRYIYVCDDPHVVKKHRLESNFPHHLFLDISKAQLKRNSSTSSERDDASFSQAIEVSSQAALEANESLRRSPTLNGSYFSELTLQSHISAVKDATFGENLDASKQTLVKGITTTCREIMERDERVDAAIDTKSPEIERVITAWTSKAHYELQTTYADALDGLFRHTIRWWNLYWKVDEVHYLVATMLLAQYLPHAQQNHKVITDDMDGFCTAHYFPELAEMPDQFPPQLTTARNGLINTAAVDLHNRAQRELVKNFVCIQLPSVFFPLLGAFFFQLPVAMCATTMGVGVTLGAIWLRRGWERAARSFVGHALEDARMAIRAEQQGLRARWAHLTTRQRAIASHRRRILDEVSGTTTTTNGGTTA